MLMIEIFMYFAYLLIESPKTKIIICCIMKKQNTFTNNITNLLIDRSVYSNATNEFVIRVVNIKFRNLRKLKFVFL